MKKLLYYCTIYTVCNRNYENVQCNPVYWMQQFHGNGHTVVQDQGRVHKKVGKYFMFLLLWWKMRLIINESDISAAEHNIATKRAKSHPNYFATIIIRHNIHFHFPLAARIDFPFKTLPSDSGNFGTLCGLKLTLLLLTRPT